MFRFEKFLTFGGIPLLLLAAVLVYPQGVHAQEPNHYVVQLKNANPGSLSSLGVNIHQDFEFSNLSQFANIYEFDSVLPEQELKNRLGDEFVYLEKNSDYLATVNELRKAPNDSGFTANSANIDKQWALPKANFIKAWRETTGSDEIIVAVIDTGIDATHEDFEDTNFVPGYDLVNDRILRSTQNSDDNGHGTMVAGVIAATSNNRIGVAGASPNVSLMAIKALNARGSGSASRIAQAIVWAADHGADVINMSLGGIGFSHEKTLADAITYAYEKNVVILSAAGNDAAITGGNLDVEPVFPICNDNSLNMVIGVTATDVNDLKPVFANYGKACVDVAAPGRRILSTINHDPATGQLAPDAYAYASGTSLAVPYVSAQAALLRSLNPDASNRQIRDRIIATADKIDQLNLVQCAGSSCVGYLGSGRINVLESINRVLKGLQDGDLVSIEDSSNEIYLINGGKRERVSAYVQNQRFIGINPKSVYFSEVENFPEGTYATPRDGTLVKTADNSTVYYIEGGLRLPVIRSVFNLRGLSFSNVFTLNSREVNSWVVGSFLTPPEGTLVRTLDNPTIYWTVNGTLHPVNEGFYLARGLNVFPVLYISTADLDGFPKGESMIK